MTVFWLLLILASLVRGIQETVPEEHNYRTYNLIQQGMCKSRRIPILDDFFAPSETIALEGKGAIVWQVWNSSSFKKFSDCKFYFQAPINMGLYLTVNKMQLRKDDRENCVDKITVKGAMNRNFLFCDAKYKEKPRVYSDVQGRIRITINLDNTLPLYSLESILEVQFLVTVKRNCDGSKDYEPCESGDENSCIAKHFFGDGFVNCPQCADESGCIESSIPIQLLNPSNLFLCAIISLFATMAVFGGCLWCLYKYRHCVAYCNVNSNVTHRSSSQTDYPVVTAVDQIALDLRRSATNITGSQLPDETNSDLPPSYDSLFPDSEGQNKRVLVTSTDNE